jgi:hypothetical protein
MIAWQWQGKSFITSVFESQKGLTEGAITFDITSLNITTLSIMTFSIIAY